MNTDVPLSWLSDDELQARIVRFGNALLEAHARYEKSGDVSDRAARDLAWVSRRELLKERGRRERIVAEMERASGLGREGTAP